MSARVAIVSDTHIPSRASEIPPGFRDRIEAADHTIHAGDFTSPEVHERVESLAGGSLTAVFGNMDPRDLDLPAVDRVTVEGVTFVVTHGTGDLETYEERVAGVVSEEAEGAVGVAGHTHEVLDTTVEGVRLLNPGSVTGAAPAERATMMTADVEAGDFDVALHEAEQR